MLPSPSFAFPPEDYAPSDPPTSCDETEKPGVVLFRDFVLSTLGGHSNDGITRPCDWGSPSHHHEGRAWDWMVNASDPADVARVELLLSWLFAPDEAGNEHAMLRRAGIDYLIWKRRIWNARERVWKAYDGYDEEGNCVRSGGCRNAHTDHVHFSFSWPGALGETSLYDFLRSGPDEPRHEPPGPAVEPAGLSGAALFWGAVGLVGGYLVVSTASRASKGVGKRSATWRL